MGRNSTGTEGRGRKNEGRAMEQQQRPDRQELRRQVRPPAFLLPSSSMVWASVPALRSEVSFCHEAGNGLQSVPSECHHERQMPKQERTEVGEGSGPRLPRCTMSLQNEGQQSGLPCPRSPQFRGLLIGRPRVLHGPRGQVPHQGARSTCVG